MKKRIKIKTNKHSTIKQHKNIKIKEIKGNFDTHFIYLH